MPGAPASCASTLSESCTDGELAVALAGGDPSAPGLVWQRFSPMIRGMARKVVTPSEIEDVEQQVFLAVFRNAQRLRDTGAFRPYVITVTRRTLGHEIRRRRARARIYSASLLFAEDVGEWSDPTSKHAFAHVQQLLARLTARERRAFLLRYVEQKGTPDIARELGVSRPTARRAYTRAQRRLFGWAERHSFLRDYL